MKPLLLVLLFFVSGTASAQTSVTIADLMKYFQSEDTTSVIKSLKQKKFKSDPDSDDRQDWYSYFFSKKIAGRTTYTETVLVENTGEILVEYSNYLHQGLQQYKQQILKAGFKFIDSTRNRYDDMVHTYIKRTSDVSEFVIELKVNKNANYVIAIRHRMPEIKTFEQ